MSDNSPEFAAITKRLQQVEKQQKVLKKYVLGLKRQLDSLTEQVQNRSPAPECDRLQQDITELQQQFKQFSGLSSTNPMPRTETGLTLAYPYLAVCRGNPPVVAPTRSG